MGMITGNHRDNNTSHNGNTNNNNIKLINNKLPTSIECNEYNNKYINNDQQQYFITTDHQWNGQLNNINNNTISITINFL